MYDDEKVEKFAFDDCKMNVGYNTGSIVAFDYGSFSMDEHFEIYKNSEYDIDLVYNMGREGKDNILKTDLLNMAIIASYVYHERLRRFEYNYNHIDSNENMRELMKTDMITAKAPLPNKFYIRENGKYYDIGFIGGDLSETDLGSQLDYGGAVGLLRDYIENYKAFSSVFNRLLSKGLVEEKNKGEILSIFMRGYCSNVMCLSPEEKDEVPQR